MDQAAIVQLTQGSDRAQSYFQKPPGLNRLAYFGGKRRSSRIMKPQECAPVVSIERKGLGGPADVKALGERERVLEALMAFTLGIGGNRRDDQK
jgi:hypothetical protein